MKRILKFTVFQLLAISLGITLLYFIDGAVNGPPHVFMLPVLIALIALGSLIPIIIGAQITLSFFQNLSQLPFLLLSFLLGFVLQCLPWIGFGVREYLISGYYNNENSAVLMTGALCIAVSMPWAFLAQRYLKK